MTKPQASESATSVLPRPPYTPDHHSIMDQLPDGLVAFGPDANCTLELCPLEASILQYQPSLPANGAFIGIFAVAMILHAFQGIRTNRWGFMLSVISGCALEIIGYVGRIIIHDNPFDFSGFLMQIGTFDVLC